MSTLLLKDIHRIQKASTVAQLRGGSEVSAIQLVHQIGLPEHFTNAPLHREYLLVDQRDGEHLESHLRLVLVPRARMGRLHVPAGLRVDAGQSGRGHSHRLLPSVHGHVVRVPHVLLSLRKGLRLLPGFRSVWNRPLPDRHLHQWNILRVLVPGRE